MEKVLVLTVDSACIFTNDDPWKDLDALLCPIAAIDEHLSTNEFVKINEETPIFNGWETAENLFLVENVRHNQNSRDTGIMEGKL